MGRPRADVRNHFTVLECGRVQCKHCGHKFKESANRMKAHLYQQKGKGVAICSKPLNIICEDEGGDQNNAKAILLQEAEHGLERTGKKIHNPIIISEGIPFGAVDMPNDEACGTHKHFGQEGNCDKFAATGDLSAGDLLGDSVPTKAIQLKPNYDAPIYSEQCGFWDHKCSSASSTNNLATVQKIEVDDSKLLEYVFQKQPEDENRKLDFNSEVIVQSKSKFVFLYRHEFTTLKPKTWLASLVIDYAAEHLTYKERNKKKSKHSIWCLPSTFSDCAWGKIEQNIEIVHKLKIRENFMSKFEDCEKILIPTYLRGHFYLYVVDLEHNLVEIWDSLDSTIRSSYEGEQEDKARDILSLLDKLFEEDIRKRYSGSWTFESFKVESAKHESTQTNGYDCGIFIIKFMLNFVENSANANKKLFFESEAERLALALELLKSDINENRETLFSQAIEWYQSQQRSSTIANQREGNQMQVDIRASQLPTGINSSPSSPLSQHVAAIAGNQTQVDIRASQLPTEINSFPSGLLSQHVAGRDQCLDEVNWHGKKRKVHVMNKLKDSRLANCMGFVGQQFMHNIAKMRKMLEAERVSIIGVHGMGGVGKTALATYMKKEIQRKGTFNQVYWITVSQEFSIHKLQIDIANVFGLPLDESDDTMRAMKLLKELKKKKKVLLILDDVWKKIDLEKVGIPLRVGGIKLILTTRLKGVCWQMNCPPTNIIDVKPLSDEEAWDLFLQKLTFDETPIKLSHEVLEIARRVAGKCKGLPLGIKVLGTTMKGVEDIHQWRNTLYELQNCTLSEKDVEDEIFKVLRFSYHKLNDKRMQECFLYCALFPEDEIIEREELIMGFVDQGLINRMKRLDEIFDVGHTVLNKLVYCSLLEEANELGSKSVKMHDLVRDMACRILEESHRYMIKSGKGLLKIPDTDEWTANLEVVSFMSNHIKEIPGWLICSSYSKLSTLIFRENPLKCIPDFFFDHMPALTVLDLSFTKIRGLPDSISNMKSLVSLRLDCCFYLKYVPPLGNLQALSRLVLSSTSIQVLPKGLERLTNLKWIDLHSNLKMKSRSGSLMSKLINLQYLILEVKFPNQITIKVEDLIGMTNLEIFKGKFHDHEHWNAYVRNVLDRGYGPKCYSMQFGSTRQDPYWDKEKDIIVGDSKDIDHMLVPKDTQNLFIMENKRWSCLCDALSFSGASSMMSCLIVESSQLETVFCVSCPCSFCTNLQNLERLRLSHLERLVALWKENEDIVKSLNPSGLFPRLTFLYIHGCKNMEKLGMLAHLPNLVTLQVIFCPKMKEIFSGVDEDNGVDCDEVIMGTHNNSNSDNVDALPKLEKLVLQYLPELKTVSQRIMACDSFQQLQIVHCPKLTSPQIRSTFEYKVFSYP